MNPQAVAPCLLRCCQVLPLLSLLLLVVCVSGAEPLIPLPPLPAVSNSTHTASATSNAAAATTNSSGSSDTAASSGVATQTLPARRRVQLHVFWDLSSLHPGGYDPRVLVAQLRRVLGCYGPVAGVYAFGIQKLFNWIPEAFMLQYAPDRLPGKAAIISFM